MFVLRDKLQRGMLTEEDLPGLKAVLEANRANAIIAKGLGPSAWSVEGRFDWNDWQRTMALFEQQVRQFEGRSAALERGMAVGRRQVDLNLRMDGQNYGSVPTDEAGEEVMEKFLSRLKRDKKRSARR